MALQSPADTVIRVRNLSKCFGQQVVLDGLDLDVRRGEVLGVVGASGTGKSVLLRSIIGLITPDAGSIDVAAQDIARRWGVLFQDGALFSSLTVLQNVQVPMREQCRLPQSALDELAYLKLAMVGLAPDAAHKYPSELSGGMRKRAGLARALALDPEIVFLDEPTSGLDPIGAAAFDALIRSLRQTLGLTVYMVSHDLDSVFAICDRVAVIADNRVVRTGAPDELVSQPQHPWVRDYFCGERARAARRL
jgi:phospholipid/cholesterol/gamma-HCH transport system ATP-binding protein